MPCKLQAHNRSICKVVLQVKTLATKPDTLSVISRTHEKEQPNSLKSFPDLHTCSVLHTPHTYIQIKEESHFNTNLCDIWYFWWYHIFVRADLCPLMWLKANTKWESMQRRKGRHTGHASRLKVWHGGQQMHTAIAKSQWWPFFPLWWF